MFAQELKVISFLFQRIGVIVREVTTVLQYCYPSCPIVPRTRGNRACARTVSSDSSRSSSLLILFYQWCVSFRLNLNK